MVRRRLARGDPLRGAAAPRRAGLHPARSPGAAGALRVFDGLDRLVLRRLDLAASRVLATRGGVVSAEGGAAGAGNPPAPVRLGREPASGPPDVAGRLFGSRVAALTPEGRRALLGAALAGPVGVD